MSVCVCSQVRSDTKIGGVTSFSLKWKNSEMRGVKRSSNAGPQGGARRQQGALSLSRSWGGVGWWAWQPGRRAGAAPRPAAGPRLQGLSEDSKTEDPSPQCGRGQAWGPEVRTQNCRTPAPPSQPAGCHRVTPRSHTSPGETGRSSKTLRGLSRHLVTCPGGGKLAHRRGRTESCRAAPWPSLQDRSPSPTAPMRCAGHWGGLCRAPMRMTLPAREEGRLK